MKLYWVTAAQKVKENVKFDCYVSFWVYFCWRVGIGLNNNMSWQLIGDKLFSTYTLIEFPLVCQYTKRINHK